MSFSRDSLIEMCPFCIELRDGVCSLFSPSSSRIVFENSNFIIFPSLGSFVEGCLLICPKVHIPSCASLSRDLLSELAWIINKTKAILRKTYQEPILFEHGLASCSHRAGGCIDHAHLHVVAADVDLAQCLHRMFTPVELIGWTELSAWQGQPYLLVQNIDGPLLVAKVPENLPSQFFRRQIAGALKLEDRWDWGAYLGLEEMRCTINKVQDAFKTIKFNALQTF